MVDSGAFGAWKRGVHLDVHDYIQFIRRYEHLIGCYFSLDVIADGWDQQEIQHAAQSSDHNHQQMKDTGLSPIPVFHQGESWERLDRMVDDGEPYVALAPHKKIDRHDVQRWLHDCFTILSGNDGRPRVKVHGLGSTTPWFVREFPWTSVDATTWLRQAGCGHVLVPRYTDGKPDYRLQHWSIPVTKQSSKAFHLECLQDWQRHQVDRYAERIGIDVADAVTSVENRWRWCIAFLVGLQKATGVQIAFGTNPSITQREILIAGGATHLLVSYFDLRSQRPALVQKFFAGDPICGLIYDPG